MTKGNGEEFEVLYKRHYARLRRFLRQQGVDYDLTEDLAQEVFTRALRTFDQYRGDAEWGFFETIARNVFYNWLRSQSARKRRGKSVAIDDPDLADKLAAPGIPDYADRDEASRNWKRLREAMAELPEGQRECLDLQLQGLKYEEIAERMNISLDAVKTRLKEAKKRLRKQLGDVDWIDLPEEDQ